MLGKFTRTLIVEGLGDGRFWRVVEPFSFAYTGGGCIDVPAGIVTDFASVPRGLWNLLPPWGKYGQAAVLHDFLYQRQTVSRAVADRLLLVGMKALGVVGWKRWLIYSGVRAGGWLAWNAHKRRNAVKEGVPC